MKIIRKTTLLTWIAAVCLKLTPVVQLYYSSGTMEVSLALT